MRKSVLFSAAAAVVVSMAWLPSEARAQGPLGDKLIVSANLGIQVGDNDLARSTTFDLYDEPATIDFAHMTEAIRSLLEPIRRLADSPFRPQWLPGGCPAPCR